ncbi:unnamed protein product [Mytilus coruscus]|uniref:Uncharacterized protein n=1 Tax=Mytilus coruscus TaxID=42192 RepID=A0A6J8CND7_MYTCO|nr:unnamed protein product [Mytilus coruscus]
MAVDIETMVTTNPNEFWEKIRKLGPRNVKDIPMEVVDESGEVLTNEKDVLNKWRIDFENLYNGKNNTEFENDHYNQSKVHKQLLESEMEDPLFMPNEDVNSNITIDEITNIVMHAKSKSASGPDQIPYGVLKYSIIIQSLQQLFQLIFDTSIIPTIWRKAIICPILKNPSSDLRVPMNYREHYFDSKTAINLKTVEMNIQRLYSNIWNDNIQQVSKLRTYITFKSAFNQEQYVKINLTKVESSHLAQFRCGILPLRIETGRYIGERPEERLCKFCTADVTETETHLLLDCAFYSDIREHVFGELLLTTSFISMDFNEKLIFLIISHTRKLAKYIVQAYFKRRNSVYK